MAEANIDADELMEVEYHDSTTKQSNKRCGSLSRVYSLRERKYKKTYIAPKDTCIFDGRLLKLAREDIDELDRYYTTLIGSGSLGEVYKHCESKPSEGFGIHIVVKKISFKKAEVNTSIRREMITSRVMHPFILPLLSFVNRPLGTRDRKEKDEVWFISPYLINGDLEKAIKGRSKDISAVTRIKILLQIAMALKHIHTAVDGVRDVILHKDISSQNIVLDENYNARLIDFGLAREKNDVTATGSGRLHYSHPRIGTGKKASEVLDYYSFGVIIRELLTSLGPSGYKNTFLKNMKKEKVQSYIDKEIWKTTSKTDKLIDISCKCLKKNNKWTVSEFDKEVVKELRELLSSVNGEIFQSGEDSKCHLCMINPAAKESSMTHPEIPQCKLRINACIACEKNSFLNPITCYCDITLTSTIGNRWGALLVAGNDIEMEGKTLACDVREIEKLILSHAPRIMGLSEENIRTVTPSDKREGEDNEELWPEVRNHLTDFSERSDIDTLLIYFSCHGNSSKENYSFILGNSSDSITKDEFQKELDRLKNIDTLLIVLDRCYPPSLKFADDEKRYVQINACGHDEKVRFSGNGSTFTKCFINGLKGRSEGKLCNKQDEACEYCDESWRKNTDFITVSSLFDFVKKHVQKKSKNKSTPTISGEDILSNIAFYTDEEVHVDFLDIQTNTEKVVPLEYFKNMEELENKLLDEFEKNGTDTKVQIQRRTYRKETEVEECDTLEKVMRAWVLRQQLEVEFKELMMINYQDEDTF